MNNKLETFEADLIQLQNPKSHESCFLPSLSFTTCHMHISIKSPLHKWLSETMQSGGFPRLYIKRRSKAFTVVIFQF